MNNEIFRQKSLERIKSPESLNDYVRVSAPGIWLLLAAVVALLAGACIWGVFGRIDVAVEADAYVEAGKIVCYVSEADIGRTEVGMPVKIGDGEGEITAVGEKSDRGYACGVTMKAVPADGVYPAEIVTERIKPISFIMN